MITLRRVRRLVGGFDAHRRRYRTVSQADAIRLLEECPEDTPIVVTTLTTPNDMIKTGNPYRDCLVARRRLVRVNLDYEEAVNDRRARERLPRDFEAAEREWGQVRPPFVLHSRRVGDDYEWKLYLAMIVEKTLGEAYVEPDLTPIPKGRIRPFLRKRPVPAQQGLRQPIERRDYTFENILAIRLPCDNGRRASYLIDHASQLVAGE